MVKHASISDAYTLLGLEQGASMDQVRSAYKQLALRTHPDKNQGNAEATVQFQQLSEAYNTLQNCHSPSEQLPYCPCGRRHDSDDEYDDDGYYFYDDDDDDDDEEEYYFYEEEYESDDDERLKFFRFLFEEVLRGRTGRRTRVPPRRRSRETPETQEEYEARLRCTREERERAEVRRAQEKAERKASEARMREKERKVAGERQRTKAAIRKAEAESRRKKTTQTVQLQQKRVQTLRSAAFAAARAGQTSTVKKAVWEDEVDPAGGEIKMGCENYVAAHPEDPMETLLHIAARNGDADLVEWLDAHSADPEERNSFGLSAFHVALQRGHIQILKHFFESYDPKEEDHHGIYHILPPKSLLSISLGSAEPEVVWMVLDRGLATSQDIGNAWTEVTSLEGEHALLTKTGNNRTKHSEIQTLLMSYGGFTPPPTPKVATQEGRPSTGKSQTRGGSMGSRGFHPTSQGARRYKAKTPRTAQAQPCSEGIPVPMQSGSTADASGGPPKNGERGKGRGRGRGRGRGYGRGPGRGRTD